MIIYYTHNYNREKGESHRLLGKAIAEYLAAASQGQKSIGECTELSAHLISDIQTSGDFGKPCIPDFAPFSISHSKKTWAVLIMEPFDCTDGEAISCGLDIQYPRKIDAEAVSLRFFAPEDAKLITDAAESDAADAFFRLWVRREAFIKAIGGSVADSDFPAVNGASAEYNGKNYRLEDIKLPGSANLYAAACFSAESDAVSESGSFTPVFQQI